MVEKKEPNAKEVTKDPEEQAAQGPEEPREDRANQIVKRYMWWSMGAGVIPVPGLDVALVAGVHLKMLHQLSALYDVEFSENKGKSIIAALVGCITADSLRRGAFTSFVKTIPVLGIIGAVAMPIYSAAINYAIGKVFIQHFESGGTFLDFDPQKVKDYFTQLYEEGKLAASKLKQKKA